MGDGQEDALGVIFFESLAITLRGDRVNAWTSGDIIMLDIFIRKLVKNLLTFARFARKKILKKKPSV